MVPKISHDRPLTLLKQGLESGNSLKALAAAVFGPEVR